MKFRKIVTILLSLVCVASCVDVVTRAQSGSDWATRQHRAESVAEPSPTPPSKEEETLNSDDVLRVETNLTNVFFTAADKDRRFISTIKKEDVRILEDGVPQQIFTFQLRRTHAAGREGCGSIIPGIGHAR